MHAHFRSALINIFVIIIFLLLTATDVIFITEKQLVLLFKGQCHRVYLPLDLKFCFSFGAATVLTLLALQLFLYKTKCISKSIIVGMASQYSAARKKPKG